MEDRAETDEVTKEDIPELLNFLNPVASKCYHLGLQLGVDSGELDNIKENYRNVCEVQLCEILIKRLKQGSLTWAALLKALESKSVGEKRLAQEIRLHFLTPPSLASAQSDKPSVSSFAHHNTPSSSSPSLDPLHFKHHSSVEPPNCQSQRKESPSHRSRSQRRECPSHRSPRSRRRESPSHRSQSWRRESPSHRSRSRRRESPSHRSWSRRKESPSHRSRSQRRECPSHRSPRSRRRESPSHRSRSQRRECPSHRSPRSRRRESPSHRSRSWRRESPSHRSRSRRRESPSHTKRSRLQHQSHPQPTQHSAPQPATNQTVQNSRSPLDQYIDYVKTVYKKSEVERDTHTVKWPPTPSKVYINLVSINRKMSRGQMREYNEVTKAMVQRGDVDVVRGKKWPIDFDEIAAGDPDPSQCLEQVVLVEGAPGVGKSTFAWEFCRRWERGEIAQQYQLVLLLRLRDERMSQAKTLWDLVYHPFEVVQQVVVIHLGHSLGLNTLFILEGFDELPDACRMSGSVFLQLIHGKLLPHATVMVTSRPWAVEFLIKDCANRISQHIEILGFTKTQISEYMKSVLSAKETKNLQAYIRRHPQLKGCMYIPLNTAIVVTVYQESQASGFPMPTTLTELYIALVQTLILRYLHSHPNLERSGKIFHVNVPLEVQNCFTKLCLLAYKGFHYFESDKIQLIFGKSDLPEDFDNLGFMDSVTELYVTCGTVSSHNFLHLTFQEFLAAVHISNMSSEEQLRHFRKHWDSRFKVVLRFLAGFTKLSCLLNDSSASKAFMSSPKSVGSEYNLKPHAEVTADLANWMFEAQSDEINEKLFGTGLLQFTCARSILPVDYYSLGYCIVHSQCEWLLDLTSSSKEKAEMLVAGASERPIGRSRVIGLKLNARNSRIFYPLRYVLNLQELSLSIPENIVYIPWPDLSSLQVLHLDGTLKSTLPKVFLPYLKSLIITVDGIMPFYNYVAIRDFIRITETLREIILKCDNNNNQGMETIAEALLNNQSLERLTLNTALSFTDTTVDCLAQFITSAKVLQYLGIGWRTFCFSGLKLLAQIIRCNSKLPEKERRRLRILFNKMHIEDLATVSQNVPQCNYSLVYLGNELPLEFEVLIENKHMETTLQLKSDDIEDLDNVLRAYPNIGQNLCIDLHSSVNSNDLLLLDQVLCNNHIPQVKVTLVICDGEDIKVLDEVLREHPDMDKHISLSFSGHPTLSEMTVQIMNCSPIEVEKIKAEYPDYIQNIDSIFSLSNLSLDE